MFYNGRAPTGRRQHRGDPRAQHHGGADELHPVGRDNGYVLSFDGFRSTSPGIPNRRTRALALENIDLCFL